MYIYTRVYIYGKSAHRAFRLLHGRPTMTIRRSIDVDIGHFGAKQRDNATKTRALLCLFASLGNGGRQTVKALRFTDLAHSAGRSGATFTRALEVSYVRH